MHDFLVSMDKTRTGLIPASNFLKVMRVFGVPLPSNQIINSNTNGAGMVDYEKVVEILSSHFSGSRKY